MGDLKRSVAEGANHSKIRPSDLCSACFGFLGINYLEHFMLKYYIAGQQALLYPPFVLLNSLDRQRGTGSSPRFLCHCLHLPVGYCFFETGNCATQLPRSLLMHVLYLFFNSGFLLGIVGLSISMC